MADRPMVTVDANEAVASVAHRLSEVIAIYPITPSSPMGEFADDWSSRGMKNLWGTVPDIQEMQSEGGAAGAVHGALQAGALTTTFTASQGLLLMIPNMYKIAGELNSFVMHVTARALATHALSIFGDHSDVYACRQTGFAMLTGNSGQEAMDFAAVCHAATLRTRVPFMNIFDGFRTSHEVSKIETLLNSDLEALLDPASIQAHRARALTPDRPQLRGTAQNPDTFFQAREACNLFYDAVPGVVQQIMDQLAALVGRQYHLFDYVGHPEAERVIVMMGSGAEAAHETVEHLVAGGEKVGLVKVRLYRPFCVESFLAAVPASAKTVMVLDRTKEPGAVGEPLYQDVVAAFCEGLASGQFQASMPRITGGIYGLSSKEFTPAMVKAVYDEASAATPKQHFTVGIIDDVTHRSIPVDGTFDIEADNVSRSVFFGLGADGTVGANKNSIKIIGEETDNYAQGYFVYDSKKSGAMTISHLRFGPKEIRSTYLISRANFVACHQPHFMENFDVLGFAQDEAVFLLNTHYSADEAFNHLPLEAQEQILAKRLRCYVIDAYEVAKVTGMGGRINTIMQTCFFAISGVLPKDEAIDKIKQAIKKTYGKKGDAVVQANWAAVDGTLANLHEMQVPAAPTTTRTRPPLVPDHAPDFVKSITAVMMKGEGDLLPVSVFSPDGTWPTATTQYEKRNIALDVPIWDSSICIQCNKCSLVCPHGAIRAKVYDEVERAGAPDTFRSVDFKGKDFKDLKFTIQVAPEDCTGCTLCVSVCPAKDKSNPRHKAINMTPLLGVKEAEVPNYDFFLNLPELDRTALERIDNKGSQFLLPLFEYSGACAGCGETPYVKLVSQLFGDRMLVANATGCSSIYGGNLPTTPYCTDANGRGPAWSNSLFEDNAEFGLGFRLAVDSHRKQAQELLVKLGSQLGDDLTTALLNAPLHGEANIKAQRERVAILKDKLKGINSPEARWLEPLADYLVRKSVWVFGGDGWAYDIGYGGMAMSYRHVYVASVALGAKDNQVVQAMLEADSYDGPSLIIAYSHCIAHGYDLSHGLEQQKLAVDSGIWPLYRFDPRRIAEGEPPLKLDSGAPKVKVVDYMRNETRFRMVEKIDPKRFADLAVQAQDAATQRVAVYQQMAQLVVPPATVYTNGANGESDGEE